MNFEDEDYVRLYARDTPTWKALGWEGQTVLCLMMRKVGRRTGELECEGFSPEEAVASVTDLPVDIVTRGFAALVKRGVAVVSDGKIVLPKFLSAQWARRGDAARKRESRDAQVALDSVTTEPNLTPESQSVTASHTKSQPSRNVTTLLPNPIPSHPTKEEIEDLSELRSSSSGKPDPALASSRAVFDCWRQEHGHPGAMFSAQRQARIKARFREGFTEEQLCLAIKQAKNDHYLMGVNDDGKRYDELESLLSKASKVERLLALTEPTKPNGRKDPKPMQANSNYDFAGAMK